MRREFSAKTKVAAYERSQGRCEACALPLQTGRFHYDHVIPDGLGGEPVLENCMVLCTACHGAKTAGADVPRIAKMKRQKAKHLGAKTTARPMPGSRASGMRKRMSGKVERW
jgi:5-methylcytosine-specific restriction protein A